eukprot:TRINITY_DN284_c1_g7_i1.p1 TRINITY_DN284_c1_g7~~TRINITY_DN284_c1_g7_i1.p1  ORF type:complete len:208 (-),score=29.11 TRINITY_DN284_c1_g7_i1:163-786(-)
MSTAGGPFKTVSGQSVPAPLKWTTEPITWSFDSGRLIVQPHPKTNFLNPLNTGSVQSNACYLYQSVSGDFTFSCRVGGSLVAPGDAAAVTLWVSAQQWAKICLAKGKSGEKRIQTVVTNPLSDDSLGEVLKTANAILRISRRGEEFVMHYSVDGKKWRFVRLFAWKQCPSDLNIGVHAQSPSEVGQCVCEFTEWSLASGAIPTFGQD